MPDATTRQALLDAAVELFSERGFDGVGVREITAKAGANIAAIAYHFGSKRDLYVAAVDHALDLHATRASWELLRDAPTSRAGAARLLACFVESFAGSALADAELNACGKLLLQESLHPTEAAGAIHERFVVPHEELLVQCLAVLAPALGPDALLAAARSVLGQLVHYSVFRPILATEPLDVKAIAGHVTHFSLRGLGCTERFIERALTGGTSRQT